MFRQFSTSLFKPQSVLFTFGYGFRDDHINRIIYQALSIPTFNLVIVLPEGKTRDDNSNYINPELGHIIDEVKSQRISVISGGKVENEKLIGMGTLEGFVSQIMPDMDEMKIQEKINEEMERLFKNNKTKPVDALIPDEMIGEKESNNLHEDSSKNDKRFGNFIMKIFGRN